MSADPFFSFNPVPEATPIGPAVGLLEDEHGGQVFLHGVLAYVWDRGDAAARRATAVALWRIKAATASQIGAAFGGGEDTIWRWHRAQGGAGLRALVTGKTGPKGGSKLTPDVIGRIHGLKASGLSNRAAAEQAGVSEFSVRRAMTLDPATGQPPVGAQAATLRPVGTEVPAVVQDELPLLADPEPRTHERVAASVGGLPEAVPVFTPAARVPYAGLLLALPALEATGLRGCVHQVYGCLKPGFHGLDTMILETVLRTLAGEPRAEGATRLDPVAFGQILGMDRAPEVRTVRRKHQELAAQKQAGALLEALGRHHLATHHTTIEDGLVLYADGHVRSYQGTKKTSKQYSTRLKFPTPATMETWVADRNGAPVFMVMAEPNSSLVGELHRLIPTLRRMVGDQRRVLFGFDREGYSPHLFHELITHGFDPLTWRKGDTKDVEEEHFTAQSFTDRWGVVHEYAQVADTTVSLEYGAKGKETRFTMRQISRIVGAGTQAREATGQDTRQIHLLTGNTELGAAELLYTMSSRWRQENYFRFARQHFALDSHDSYKAVADDAGPSVPNPATDEAKRTRDVLAAKLNGLVATVESRNWR